MGTAISFRGVSAEYPSGRALDDVTLDIPVGATVAIIGPNGSGKSTLLKLAAGLQAPTAGSIERSGDTAIVLQSTDVDPSVPISVRDVVAMARYPTVGVLGRFTASDRDQIATAMRKLRVDEFANRQIHHLSGGQRQRVFVAQGLAQDAPILLLDEPITGLDVTSRAIIESALDDEHEAGRTVVITTHNFQDAERCDLVVLLATRCVATGPAEVVLTESHLQEAFGGRFVRVGDTLVLDDPHHHGHRHEHEHDHRHDHHLGHGHDHDAH